MHLLMCGGLPFHCRINWGAIVGEKTLQVWIRPVYFDRASRRARFRVHVALQE